MCVSSVFGNIYFVKLLGVVKEYGKSIRPFHNQIILVFSGKKHFTFLEVKWTGFSVHNFCVVWGSIFCGGMRRGEEMIQVIFLLVFIMGIMEYCYIWNCVDFDYNRGGTG